MNEGMDRRRFLGTAAAAGLSGVLAGRAEGQQEGVPVVGDAATPGPACPLLTEADDFVDVSRGNPRPFTLEGEALIQARLTPETWRLEIVPDESAGVERPARIEDGTALDLDALRAIGEEHGVGYLKAMQCNNIAFPLGQGLWEGVPLREILRRVGPLNNVRRVYYWGFHNNDPAQIFQSSLALNQALESPPGMPPPIVAYRLNGRDIPLKRGGPVRMIIPWAHGFKSIKWLQRIVLTNDHQANDTYALQNNDPESYLKTAAYLPRESPTVADGEPLWISGTAMSGWSGLRRVEYWLRPATGEPLDDDDPAWQSADWRPCTLMPPPQDWRPILPAGTEAGAIWGFDPATGTPRTWPLPFSTVPFTARLDGLRPGTYEFRARTVDLNGLAQPEPRPYPKSGRNAIPVQTITVTA